MPQSTLLPARGFKLNLLANFAGNGWAALLQLICVPFYIKFMGIESYGLIGFYIMLQAMLQVLDLGLSPTINREMARYSVQPEKMDHARDLVRTLEIGYWLTGIAIGLALLASSAWLSRHWVHANSLPPQTITHALMLMGILSIFQWPLSFYQGGLMGLHRQVLYNTIRILVSTLNTVGAVLVLWLVSPTITALLSWQVAVSAFQAALLMLAMWKSLRPATRPARFSPSTVRPIWRFAAGMSAITLLGLMLTQIDKVFVSKLLSLRIFGYYSLAWTVASGLLVISGIVFNVVFPRMTAQVAAGDDAGLLHTYHAGSQLMAVLILPLTAVLLFFSFDVLRLWTANFDTALHAAPILSVLVVGSACNALFYLPFSLQLAHGWTRLNLASGLVWLFVAAVAIIPLIRDFGAPGAAMIWAGFNALNILIIVPIMHRRLLPLETRRYFSDFGLALMAAFAVAALGRLAVSRQASPAITLLAIFAVWIVASLMVITVSPDVRSVLVAHLVHLKPFFARRSGTVGN